MERSQHKPNRPMISQIWTTQQSPTLKNTGMHNTVTYKKNHTEQDTVANKMSRALLFYFSRHFTSKHNFFFSKWPPAEIHFRLHFSPNQIKTELFF
jgi:hypothetical protein